MEQIDGKWIAARLTGRRGEKVELAHAAQITPKQLSDILANRRAVKQAEAAMILRFFGQRVEAPSDALRTMQGFAEPSVEPYTPPTRSNAARLLEMSRTGGRNPALHRLARDVPELNLERGDLLIVDMKASAPPAGGMVVCNIKDAVLDEYATEVRRFYPPWLTCGSRAARSDDGTAAIFGTVIATVRGTLAEA